MIPIQHIHPMLVHFPIVLVFALAAFDLVATMRRAEISGRTASGNLSTGIAVLAALSAVAAYFLGGMALDIAEAAGFSSPVAEAHETLGGILTLVLVAWAIVRAAFWWRNWHVSGNAAYAFPLVAIGCAALVAATAFYGGQLVFDLGVNVAKIAAAG